MGEPSLEFPGPTQTNKQINEFDPTCEVHGNGTGLYKIIVKVKSGFKMGITDAFWQSPL